MIYQVVMYILCRSQLVGGFTFLIPSMTGNRLCTTTVETTTNLCQQYSSSISILHESDNLLVINKPHQISHHDSGDEIGILTLLRNLQASGKMEYKGRLYGVHRLDRITSGILLLAKNKETAQSLSNSFRTRSNITKYYVALSNKKPKKKQGWVKGDMVPSRRGSFKLTKSMDNPASSRFYTAGLGKCDSSEYTFPHSSIEDEELSAPKTMILFQPLTGKTHQLRVASKSLGLPILGDKMYGDANEAKKYNRTYLHAIAMHVQINGEDIVVWNPPDDWFTSKTSQQCDENAAEIPETIMYKLFYKHCTNHLILEAISNHTMKKMQDIV
jgi:tRNA pseudouridine32 synthase/23S rRNA pseudouridine746 synthase